MKPVKVSACLILSLIGGLQVFAQYVPPYMPPSPPPGGSASLRASSTFVPVGYWVDMFVTGSPECTLSVKSWTVNGSTTSSSASYKSMKWTSPTTVRVYATYSCRADLNPTATNFVDITVRNANPSFNLSLTSTSICPGGALVASATQIIDANGSGINDKATFEFRVDNGQSFYNGTASSRPVPTGNLAAGQHTLKMSMTSFLTGTTVSRSVNFTVKPNLTFSISDFHINGMVCKNNSGNTQAPVSVLISNPNSLGPFSYNWWINNGSASIPPGGHNPTTDPFFTYPSVNDGDRLYVKVTNQNTDPNKCSISDLTSKTIVVNVVENGLPKVDIVASKFQGTTIVEKGTTICSGTRIYFESSQEADTYHWYVDGVDHGTDPSINLVASANSESSGTFTSDRTVRLDVTGVSSIGQCLSSTSATTSISGSDYDIYPTPSSVITPSGTVVIKTTATQTLSVPTGAGLNYQWQRLNEETNRYEDVDSENDATISVRSGQYRVEVDGVCSSTSAVPTIVNINHLPTVSVDAEKRFDLPEEITVDAVASDPEGPVNLIWTKQSGPSVTLVNNHTSTVQMTNATPGVYVLRVTGTDNTDESLYDEVKVYVYPHDNYNYVRENVVNKEGITSFSQVSGLSTGDRNQTTTYFDELGRPIQKIVMKATPASTDLVQDFEYDKYGREAIKYLPYPVTQNTGLYSSLPAGSYYSTPQSVYYKTNFNDSVAFASSVFDQSPLNRVIEQGAPGQPWQVSGNATIKSEYLVNVIHEVLKFSYDQPTGEFTLPAVPSSDDAYYEANTLLKQKTTDEDGNDVVEFVDSENRKLCRKVKVSTGVYASTYYLYDDFGNLVIVIPPEGVERILNPNGN